MQKDGMAIYSAKVVQKRIKEETNIEISEKKIRKVLKKECKLSFVKSKKLNVQANSDRALVLR